MLHLHPNRFLIVAQARSGSTLLRTTLNSQKSVCCHGELFGFKRVLGYALPTENSSKTLFKLRETNHIDFLKEMVFPNNKNFKAIGFKLLHDHIEYPPFAGLIEVLRQDKNLKIIFLERENQFKRYVSHEIHRNNLQIGKPKNVPGDAIEKAFQKTKKQNKIALWTFHNQPSISIRYEDLIRNFDEEIAKIQKFLGVDQKKLKMLTKPSKPYKYDDVIKNWEEIKKNPLIKKYL